MDNNEKKAQFHDALTFLVESANINAGAVTVDEIKSTFDGIIEDESMFPLIYNYLLEHRIKIDGLKTSDMSQSIDMDSSDESDLRFFNDEGSSKSPDICSDMQSVSASASAEDSKEQNIINMYMNDMQSADGLSADEEADKLAEYISDHMNRQIVNELIETNLRLVPSIANMYKNQGVSYGDLLQEGNLGLIEGVMTYKGTSDTEEFHQYLTDIIKNAMNDAVVEQNASSRIGFHAADRANELDRASVTLSKELDRTPTLEELAKYLSLPEDEVERIMKMSLNALTIDESIDE